MKNIILANIGNRNLTYKQQTIPNPRQDQPGQSFRERTQELRADYDNIKADLGEQILSVLVAHLGVDTIEKVVLFASDNQIEGDRNNQDTIYEAQLLQLIWTERLSLRVEIVTFTRNVTHNDDLLRFYRDVLRPYQATDTPIVICDAGGTAQQKAALKIAAEYLLDPVKYQVRYVDNGRVTTVEQVEYRRIIDEEQVATLVEHGQYAGALSIYNQLVNTDSDVSYLLEFLYKRSELFWKEAQGLITNSLADKSTILSNFKAGIPLGTFNSENVSFEREKLIKLSERLEIAEFRLLQKDWTRATLGLSIFIESVVNTVIHKFSLYKVESNYSEEASKLLQAVKTEDQYDDLRAYFTKIQTGVPLHLKFAQKYSSGILADVLHVFCTLNSYTNGSNGKRGLDCLRNDIAHKGRSIKEKDLRKQVPDIEAKMTTMRQLLGFPKDNTYMSINQLLLSRLRS